MELCDLHTRPSDALLINKTNFQVITLLAVNRLLPVLLVISQVCSLLRSVLRLLEAKRPT
jgi:hypothetical protein